MNQVAKDLEILVPPPQHRFSETSPSGIETLPTAHENLQKWDALIEESYLNRREYPAELIQKWINILRTQDKMITKTITYGSRIPKKITLRDESERFVSALEAMLTKKGTAEVPFYDANGVLTATRKMEVGGDLLPLLEGVDFKDSSGALCDKVICILNAVYQLQAEDEARSGGRPSLGAAYDALFLYFRHQYIVSLQVPKAPFVEGFTFKSEIYALAKNYFLPMTPSELRVFNVSLWNLPPIYSGMKTLNTVHAATPYQISGAPNLSWSHYDSSVRGLYNSHILREQGKVSVSELGAITFNRKSWLKYEIPKINVYEVDPKTNDYVYEPAQGGGEPKARKFTRRYTDWEVKTFAPDLLASVEWDARGTVAHELSHALDHAISLPGPAYREEGGISQSIGWLDLSGWIFTNRPDLERKVEVIYPGMTKYMLDEVKTNRTWDVLPDAFTWSYGMISPGEDFAVAVSDYISDPTELSQRAPQKIEFLKEHLFTFTRDGRDYVWTFEKPNFKTNENISVLRDQRFKAGLGYYDFSRQETRPQPEWERRETQAGRYDPVYINN